MATFLTQLGQLIGVPVAVGLLAGGSGAAIAGMKRPRRRWVPLVATLVVLALALVAVPLAYAGSRAMVGFVKKASLADARVCRCSPDREVELRRDTGLKIAASLYGAQQPGKRPAILLLHGDTPLGRRLPLYRIMATKLADAGYVVLAIDLPGYGESGDPFSLNTPEGLDPDLDVRAALEYLKSLENVVQERLYIVAHSGGAVAGLSLGTKLSDVRGIVAIGPPRRVSERLRDPAQQDYFWERALRTRNQVYGAPFPDWYTRDLHSQLMLRGDLEQYRGYFSKEGHKPLILIDGALESAADREYLAAFNASITQPKEYVSVPGSDHYANTQSLLRALVLYDSRAVEQTVDAITAWLRANN